MSIFKETPITLTFQNPYTFIVDWALIHKRCFLFTNRHKCRSTTMSDLFSSSHTPVCHVIVMYLLYMHQSALIYMSMAKLIYWREVESIQRRNSSKKRFKKASYKENFILYFWLLHFICTRNYFAYIMIHPMCLYNCARSTFRCYGKRPRLVCVRAKSILWI